MMSLKRCESTERNIFEIGMFLYIGKYAVFSHHTGGYSLVAERVLPKH